MRKNNQGQLPSEKQPRKKRQFFELIFPLEAPVIIHNGQKLHSRLDKWVLNAANLDTLQTWLQLEARHCCKHGIETMQENKFKIFDNDFI